MRWLLTLLVIEACAAEPLEHDCTLPCDELACVRVDCVDQRPTLRAICTCVEELPNGEVGREACTIEPPRPCGDLTCDGIQCGELTPEGDIDPTVCVCFVTGERPQQCVGQ